MGDDDAAAGEVEERLFERAHLRMGACTGRCTEICGGWADEGSGWREGRSDGEGWGDGERGGGSAGGATRCRRVSEIISPHEGLRMKKFIMCC